MTSASRLLQREVSTRDADAATALMQAENGDWRFFPEAGSSARPFAVTLRQYVDDGVIVSRNSVVGRYSTCGGSADFGVPLLTGGTWEWESHRGARGSLREGPMLMRPNEVFFSRHEDLEVTNVYVTPEAMNRVAAEVYGVDDVQIDFTSGTPITPAHGAYFASLIAYTSRAVAGGAFENDLVRAALLRNLAVGMLECFPLAGDDPGWAVSVAAHERVFRTAVEYMHAHASLAITINDVARAAGCSVAELDRAFVAQTMKPASAYLWGIRLQGAHRDLLAADGTATTVDEVAARWGYPTTRGFERRYLHAYGRPPMESLLL